MKPNVPGTKRSHSWRCQYTVLAVTGLLLTFEAHTQTIAVALDQAWSRHPQAVTFVARLDEAKARGDLAGSFTPNPPAISLSNATDRLNADAAR
jgi:cobalt-zinc-cadmium efflux system outer membrane protein